VIPKRVPFAVPLPSSMLRILPDGEGQFRAIRSVTRDPWAAARAVPQEERRILPVVATHGFL
jgi:hypothetical protein